MQMKKKKDNMKKKKKEYEKNLKKEELKRLQEKVIEYRKFVTKMSDEMERLKQSRIKELEIYNDAEENLNKENENLDKCSLEKACEDVRNKLKKAEEEVKKAEMDVKEFIDGTGVDEENISDFLKLTNSLMPQSLNNVCYAQELNQLMNNVKILLERRLTDKLTIQDCLGDSKVEEEIILALTEAGGYYMDDITVSSNDFDTDIIPLLPQINGKNIPKLKLLKIKKLCTDSSEWKGLEKSKNQANYRMLFKSSEVLGRFFGYCYVAIKEANQLLQLNGPENMNAEQQQVIKENPDVSKLKQLTLPTNNKVNQEQKTEEQEKKKKNKRKKRKRKQY